MRVRGVGVDIVSIKRIEKVFSKYGDKFLNRFLFEKEKEQFRDHSRTCMKRALLFLASR